jgi:hypothetical protein
MIWKNFGQVFIMALGFLILNTAYETCENLSTRILKSAGLTWMSKSTLTILSLSSAIASFFMTPIVQSIDNIKMSMFIGAIFYSVWIWAFLIPVYYREEKLAHKGEELDEWYMDINFVRAVLILSAILNGVGAALLFVSQGLLISECATHENKGLFNGFYWSVFMASLLSANQVSIRVIEALDAK